MEYKEFKNKIKAMLDLDDQEAEKAIEATLETLGERLERPERNKLAAPLQNELKTFLLKRSAGSHFTLEDFFTRIGARSGGIHYTQTVERSKAVLIVLKEAVTDGDIQPAIKKLPHEFKELFSQTYPVS
ncbi:MAG: DUF2267 domain-containing protein [Chitinispirillaceae bacterium]